MKKILYGLMLAIACIMATGCSCQSENKKQESKSVFSTDYDGVVPDLSEDVEHIVSLQRETMFKLAGGADYVWYETKFTFADSLTYETIAETQLMEVTSVFQTFKPELCYMITTNAVKGTLIPAPTPGLWIEDFDLSSSEIKLTVNDVLQRLQEWDGILPPAKTIILRKPVGPVLCNAQYVVGNIFTAVWVDAVTGDVKDKCPAFPE